MKTYVLTFLVTVLVSLALAHKSADEQHHLEKRNNPSSCIYLCDCLSNSATRSIAAFFDSCPKIFPSVPSSSEYLTNSQDDNIVAGGDVLDAYNRTFRWSNLNPDMDIGSPSGEGNEGSNKYLIFRDSGKVVWPPLLTALNFSCTTHYRAQLNVQPIGTAVSNFSSISSGSVSVSTFTPTSMPMLTQTPTNAQEPPPVYTGLSLGARISIAVVSVVAFVLLLTLIMLRLRRHRSK